MKKLREKWKSMPDSAKSAIMFGICSFINSAISFLVTPAFTRIMSTEQYGVVTDYNSWRYIIEVFAVLGLLSVGAFNVGLNEYRECRDQYIANMLILSNIATVIVFGLLFAVKFIFLPEFILPQELLWLMLLYFLFNPALSFWLARQRYEYKYKLSTVITLSSVMVSQGLAVLLVLLFGAEEAQEAAEAASNGMLPAFWKQLGTVGGLTLFAVPIYIGLMKKGKNREQKQVPPRRTMWKQVLVFTLPLIPHYLAMHVMNGADRIMVGKLISSEAEAIFGVVSTIGTIATIAWLAINASLVPYIFENMNVGRVQSIRKTTTLLALGYMVLCIFVCLVAPEALLILAPEEYQSGVYAIPPIAAMAFFNALYNIFASIEFYYKKSVGIAVATVVATLTDIGLNFWLIPKFGLVAAAYTTLVANAIMVLAHYIGYRRCSSKQIFNDGLLFAMAAVCTAVCLACSLFYDNIWLRYGMIAVLLTGAVINRKRIIGLLGSLKER